MQELLMATSSMIREQTVSDLSAIGPSASFLWVHKTGWMIPGLILIFVW